MRQRLELWYGAFGGVGYAAECHHGGSVSLHEGLLGVVFSRQAQTGAADEAVD